MMTLRSLLGQYLEMRRALGFKLHTEGTGLQAFVTFMEQTQAAYITIPDALAWARKTTSSVEAQAANRLRFVRGFARYCSAFDARTEIPSADLISWRRVRPQPYFFAAGDIEGLLKAALELAPSDGLRRWTYHCLYGLLSVSGMRICEARALTLDAESHAGHGETPRLRYFEVAFGTMREGRPLRQLALDAGDRVLHRCIDLILYGAIARPTRRHVRSPEKVLNCIIADTGRRGSCPGRRRAPASRNYPLLCGANVNFCPASVAAYMRPPFAIVNTAMPF